MHIPESREGPETVEESEKKALALFRDKLKMTVAAEHIEVAHRVGKFSKAKDAPHRPIIVRFRSREVKYSILKVRKQLKGMPVSLAEDMCNEYRKLEGELRQEKALVVSSWFTNGKLFAQDKLGNKHQIKFGADWRAYFPGASSTPVMK